MSTDDISVIEEWAWTLQPGNLTSSLETLNLHSLKVGSTPLHWKFLPKTAVVSKSPSF